MCLPFRSLFFSNGTPYFRIFHIKLHPDTSIFANDVEVSSTSGPVNSFDPTSAYVGTLEGTIVIQKNKNYTINAIFIR